LSEELHLNTPCLGATGQSTTNQSGSVTPHRPIYPQERKEFYDRVSRDAPSISPASRRTSGPPATLTPERISRTTKEDQAMSFVMLSESQVAPPSSTNSANRPVPRTRHSEAQYPDGAEDENKAMSNHAETANKLFEILTARSDIDHPICTECTDLLVDGLQKRLEVATKERDAFVGFLKQAKAEVPTEEEIRESQEALMRAQEEEAEAIKELEKLEKERAEVEEEIAALEEESRELDIKEQEFWSSRNEFAMKLSEFQNERDSVNTKYDHDSQQLQKLQRTNVYNDTFCISHDGNFGTINGLRLGRLSSVPVDWTEINAAWGHTMLLLATVAEKLGYQFQGYRLRPIGSTSRIEKLDYPSPSASHNGSAMKKADPKISVLELHSSGDLPLGLTFMHRRFDNAMVAFLECLRQLGEFVEVQTANPGPSLKLPYEIKKDKIGDISIKLGVAQDDAWSKACKFTLTCCKFLLAHASNISGRRSGP
jgi:beclin 1